MKQTFELRPFQVEGAMFLEKHHYAILGDDMGLGKSVQALTLVNSVRDKTLISVPAYLIGNWQAEVDKFYPHLSSIIDIVSYSSLKKVSWKSYGTVIADEAHYLKNLEAQRTETFLKMIQTHRPERLALLSGTPIINSLDEFYPLLVLCGLTKHKTNGHNILHYFDNYWKFVHHFCEVKKKKIPVFDKRLGKKVTRIVTEISGYKNLGDLKKFLQLKYLRRMSDDILDLPTLIHLEVNLNKKDVEGLELEFETGTPFPTKKVESALHKVPSTVEYVIDVQKTSGGSVVIFTDHRKSQAELVRLLIKKGFSVLGFDGSVESEKRFTIVTKFQEGNHEFLVITSGSGSTGYNITKATDVVFNDLPWKPGIILQCVKRIYRIGQVNKCRAHYINLGPIDARINKKLRDKTLVLEAVL